MTADQLAKLAKSKDEDVRELVAEYEKIMSSDNLTSYLSMRDQLRDWDEQLKIKPDELKEVIENEGEEDETTVSVIPGRIDLFADKDTREFERAIKYYDKILMYRKTLSDLRAILTEEEAATLIVNEKEKKSKEKNRMLAI